MSTISASIARQSLPTQLDRVEAGEEVSITRHGKVVAVLVRPDVLAARRATAAWDAADRIAALLNRARSQPLVTAVVTPRRAEELIDSLRENRAAR
ncbi:type II toxin-antitoxin system Phd/YefM family antitoxin [Microbacterium sp. K24]|uniref:type II toxin-antitoxin system Phd/YefM family antitoxin n=1 Tax=Microbacterium sp. K24 TaxID=2305446 RepID=UPI00109C4AC6|nr:type II toxin-antitoxin system Phd/YefM family antitoxin [Microbacterium sp. K24]